MLALGCARAGGIDLNEDRRNSACNPRGRCWLYVVYDCATPTPRLMRVQDPFYKLAATAKGDVIIDEEALFSAAADVLNADW